MKSSKAILVSTTLALSVLLTGCDLLFPKELSLCEDPKVKLFLNQVFRVIEDIDFIVVEINNTLERIEQNPLLLISSSFLDGLTDQVNFALGITETALALTAPRIEFESFIDLFKGSFQDYANAIQFLDDGLAEQDAFKLLSAVPTFLSGKEKLDEAIIEFNGVIDECLALSPL